jgi:endonuclease-3 related protein
MAKNTFLDIYTALLEHYGHQDWWPADTPLEMIVGAVLTQNTNWKNVTKALSNLKNADLLEFDYLNTLSLDELAEYIRPAGYYNLKAKRLKNLLRMIAEEYNGDLQQLFDEELDCARSRLLQVNGVGEETADSILLYAAKQPIFVVDAYTHRVFSRHNLLEEECSYADIQVQFMDSLPRKVSLYNEYHALIVKVAKEYCKKNKPCCQLCPLEKFL